MFRLWCREMTNIGHEPVCVKFSAIVCVDAEAVLIFYPRQDGAVLLFYCGKSTEKSTELMMGKSTE